MTWTIIFIFLAVGLYFFHPHLNLIVVRKAISIALFLELFYLSGSLLSKSWPFPTPLAMIQIILAVFLGIALGVTFSLVWPISPNPGFERIIRTLLIFIPSLGLGIGLQTLLQGQQATQAIYLIFVLAAWLGSGHFIRK